MKRLWILLVIVLEVIPSDAQIFGPINRVYAHKHRDELRRRLHAAKPDSNQVFLLLDISNAYLKTNAPDSCLFFSRQAIRLGRFLHMREEEQQGEFLVCRAYAMKG